MSTSLRSRLMVLVTFCWGATLFGVSGSAARGESYAFELAAGEHDRGECPVIVALPMPVPADVVPELRVAGSAATIPVQWDGDRRAVFVLEAPLPQGESRRYELKWTAGIPQDQAGATVRRDADLLRVEVLGRPVVAYHVGTAEPPPGTSPLYRRSGHVHPVTTPGGRIVTDEFPADHLHQHALFGAWVRTRFQGRQVDFWNQLGGTGTVRHRDVLRTASGPVFAEFAVELEHVDLTPTDGPRVALLETWTLRAYVTRSGHLFEIETRQRTASDSPLVIEEYHYGGMAARGAADWTAASGANFLTNEGKTRGDGNHSRPNWVAMHGPVQGEPCGLAVFCSPDNFRAPQPVRLHPSMPYFVFSPCVLGEFMIEPGREFVSRYRYFAFDGPVDAERLDSMFQDITSPPTCRGVVAAAQRPNNTLPGDD